MLSPRALRLTACALLVAALAFAVSSLQHVDVHALRRTLAAVPPGAIGVAVALSLAQALILATRLWAVFPHHSRPGWASVARAFGFGQVVNAYTPGRAGDVVKVVTIARPAPDAEPSRGATLASATGVMLADKALDVLSLTLIAIVFGHGMLGSMLAKAHPSVTQGAIATGVLAVVGAIVARSTAARTKLGAWARATGQAARSLMTPTRAGWTLSLAIAAWVAEALLLVTLARPVGLHLTFVQAVMALVVLNVGIALPVSVANVGTFEAATVAGLLPFGASTAQALVVGTLHHVIQIVGTLVFAAAFWAVDRLRRRTPLARTAHA